MELELSGWEDKVQRDAYRFAVAKAIQDTREGGFDFRKAWYSHTEEERERAEDIFKKSLENSVLRGYVPYSCLDSLTVCSTSVSRSPFMRYLKEKCRQSVKDRKRN